MTFSIYHSQQNPTGLTGTVGGAINLDSPLSGYLGELFTHVDAPPAETTVTFRQYRKVYVRNESSKSAQSTTVWIHAPEHSGQIHIALETGNNQTTTSPTGEPTGVTGWVSPRSYLEGVGVGDLLPNQSTGVWVRQTLTNVTKPDPYVSFRLYVGGLIS